MESNTNLPQQKTRKLDKSIPEWRSKLTGVTAALLLFEIITGLTLYLLPFSLFNQFGLLAHSVLGVLMIVPVVWYSWTHWLKRKGGNFSHFQLLGYLSVALLLLSFVSGMVTTWEGLFSERLEKTWDLMHLISSLAFSVFVVLHLTTLIFRNFGRLGPHPGLIKARRKFYLNSLFGAGLFIVLCFVAVFIYQKPQIQSSFADNYNWRFGKDRPFAPSFAKLDDSELKSTVAQQVSKLLPAADAKKFNTAFAQPQSPEYGITTIVKNSLKGLSQVDTTKLNTVLANATEEIQKNGAMTAKSMAGSASCGSSNCHSQIYNEWLPSAHRYSSMDDMFAQVQTLMVKETSAEHTRYCAGCHDPISLFSGAKNSSNITLSTEGADEGASCLICHSITKTDVQGNGNYEVKVPQRYLFELSDGQLAKTISDFLIRTYPQQHLHSFSRALYKTPEFCAACHKQYLDTDVNTDIGKVQGQNQYDNWKNSHWVKDDLKDSITCRECHMPLVDSKDPARGDVLDYNRNANDNKHRSHRTLGTNQYIPALHKLKNYQLHTKLTEKWMRGEIDIPEIADKWRAGKAMEIAINAADNAKKGQEFALKVEILNNKAGHDFPTGPMDMLQAWLDVRVTDEVGNVIYKGGYLDENGYVKGLPVIYRADAFDRQGKLIDRHNLWDLVGAKYKRTLFPGMSDNIKVPFVVPDNLATGSKLTITVKLQYRKANPVFLDRVYGKDQQVRTPTTTIATTQKVIEVVDE